MNHAGHLRSVFGFDRNTVAVTTHGNNSVLQISAEWTIDHTGQCRVYTVIHCADLTADLLQRAAGIVTDLVFADDTTVNLGRKKRYRFQHIKITVQTVGKFFDGLMSSIGFGSSGCGKHLGDTQKLGGI